MDLFQWDELPRGEDDAGASDEAEPSRAGAEGSAEREWPPFGPRNTPPAPPALPTPPPNPSPPADLSPAPAEARQSVRERVGIFDPTSAPAPEPPVLARPAVVPADPPAPEPADLPTAWAAYSSRIPSGGRSVGRVTIAAGLALILGVGAFLFLRGGGGGAEDGVALAMSFQPGQTLTYRLHLRADLSLQSGSQTVPLKADLSALLAMKVVSVDTAGTATMRVDVTHAKGVVNGNHVSSPPTRGQTATVGADGRMILPDESGSLNTFGLIPTSDEIVPLLPDHPVQPGDSWTRDATAEFPLGDGGPLHLTERVTLVRYQTVHGKRVAVIQDHASIPLDLKLDAAEFLKAIAGKAPELPSGASAQIVYAGSVTQDVTGWLDPAAGRMVSFSGQAAIDATVSVTGLPAGSTAPEIRLSGTLDVSMTELRHHSAKPA